MFTVKAAFTLETHTVYAFLRIRAVEIQTCGCRGRDESLIQRGCRIRPVAFVILRQHHNLLASTMMGLQAVNETTQAHGYWTVSISMPLLTHLSRGVRTKEEQLKHRTCPRPIMLFLVVSPEILSYFGKCPVIFSSMSIIVWNVMEGWARTRGGFISHKEET